MILRCGSGYCVNEGSPTDRGSVNSRMCRAESTADHHSAQQRVLTENKRSEELSSYFSLGGWVV